MLLLLQSSEYDTVVQYESPTERRPRRPVTAGRGGGEKGNFVRFYMYFFMVPSFFRDEYIIIFIVFRPFGATYLVLG